MRRPVSTLDILAAVSALIAAGGAVTYWGGRLARGLETLTQTVDSMRAEIQGHHAVSSAHSERLVKLEIRVDDHRERIRVLEGTERASGGRA